MLPVVVDEEDVRTDAEVNSGMPHEPPIDDPLGMSIRERAQNEQERIARGDPEPATESAQEPARKSDAIRDKLLGTEPADPATEPALQPAGQPALAAEDQPTAEDLKDVPRFSDNRQKQAFIKERIRARKERERLTHRIAELEKGQVPAAQPPAALPAASQSPTQSTAETAEGMAAALQDLHKANRVLDLGEPVDGIDGDEAAQTLRQAALEKIGAWTNQVDILKVIQAADAGKFGKASAEIAEMARRELPVVQARTDAARQENDQRLAGARERLGKVAEAIRGKYEQYPALKEGESPETKFCLTWLQRAVGAPGKPGPFFGTVLQNPEAATTLIDAAMNEFRLAQQARQSRQPVARLPQAGGQRAPGSAEPQPAKKSEAIKQQIAGNTPGGLDEF